MSYLIYLHGYNSSPNSFKSIETERWVKQYLPNIECCCPALSPFPLEAIDQVESLISERQGKPLGFIGSSMGGFYATWLAEKYHSNAVLINPAVEAYRRVPQYLGENANYHTGETFVLEPHHVAEFESLEVEDIKFPENLHVLLQTGDEVLDYRLAENRYRDCSLIIEQGGDHSFQNYPQHLPAIFDFLTK